MDNTASILDIPRTQTANVTAMTNLVLFFPFGSENASQPPQAGRNVSAITSNVVKFRFLTTAQVIRLHNSIITAAQPSQPSMLESAVQSPMSIKYYTNQHNVFQLAASLSEKIIKNHAFPDGNKRTALVAAAMFLKINGYSLQIVPLLQQPIATKQTLEDALVAVCTDKWTAEQLGQYYQQVAAAVEGWIPDIMAYKNEA